MSVTTAQFRTRKGKQFKPRFSNKLMEKRTNSLESSTRKKIDLILNNLGWNTDEEDPKCNVFTERAKTVEQNKNFKGKKPDYVLYEKDTDKPIAIIEAKRKGQVLDKAIEQAVELYAKPLGVNIIFTYDGTFFKSWHVTDEKELLMDDEPVTQLIEERMILRFLAEGSDISTITPKVKHTRGELISIFRWANDLLRKEGLREGIERFTEFTNLLFLKIISELEEERIKNNEKRLLQDEYLWNSFANLEAKTMMNYINKTILPHLVERYNHSGEVFQKEMIIKNPKTLKMIVDRLSKISLMDADSDVKGDAFEYFLKSSITLGNDLGEYFTPRHLVKLMVEIIDPKFGETIYDPTCGTGGFLIHAFNYIKKRCASNSQNLSTLKQKTIFGRELTNTAKIAKMNMIITGDGHNNIKQMDTLKNPVKEKYDIVLANPPYGQTTDYGEFYPVPSNNGDAVFIQHIAMSLKEKGRSAVVIPEGLLFRGSSELSVRKWLLKNTDIKAIISLPPGVFRPYAKGNKTNIIVFEKDKKGTKSIWFYELRADGFDLNSDMRRPIGENDIPDLLEKWSDKSESENSWNVRIETIEENNFDLLAKTYKPKINGIGGKVLFSEFLTPSNERVRIKDDESYKQIKVQLYGNGAILRQEIKGKRIATKIQEIAREGDMIVSKIDARNGALAIVPNELDGAVVSSDFPLFKINKEKINQKYLEYILKFGNLSKTLSQYSKGTTNRRRIKPIDILNLKIDLPNRSNQELICERILAQERIITDSKRILSSLKKGLVDESDFVGDYELEHLTDVCEDIKSGGTPTRTNPSYFRGNIHWVKISDFKELDIIIDTEEKITKEALENSSAKLLPKDTVLVSIFATIGAVSILGIEASTNQAIAGLIPNKKKIIPEYLMYYLYTLKPYYVQKSRGVAQNNINLTILKDVKIKVPKIDIQKEICSKINERKKLLIELEERKKESEEIIRNIMNELGLLF